MLKMIDRSPVPHPEHRRPSAVSSMLPAVALALAAAFSAPAAAQCNLPTPIGLQTFNLQCAVWLEWSPVFGASQYEIWRGPNPEATTFLTQTTSQGQYTDSTAPPGVIVHYRVKAKGPGCTGGTGLSSSAGAIAAAPTPLPPPNFQTIIPECGPIRVTWGAVSGAAGYLVQLRHPQTGAVLAEHTPLPGMTSALLGNPANVTHVAVAVACLTACPGGTPQPGGFQVVGGIELRSVPLPMSNISASQDGLCGIVVTWTNGLFTTSVTATRRNLSTGLDEWTRGVGSPLIDTDNLQPGVDYQYRLVPANFICGPNEFGGGTVVGRIAALPTCDATAPIRRTVGQTATFAAPALEGPGLVPSFQWRRGGVDPSGTDGVAVLDGPHISGAATNLLTIDPIASSDADIYRCVVRWAGGACTWVHSTGLFVTPTCPADFNQSGVVSVQDLFDFLAAFFAGCP